MTKPNAHTPPLPWWAAGILLGLVQVLAFSLAQSLDISQQFVNTNTRILESIAPEYVQSHPIMNNEEYNNSSLDWWLGIGIVIGAFIAAVHLRIWKFRATTDLWQQNHDTPIVVRMIIGFFGGFLMLLGAAISYSGIIGHSFSGLAQLSLSGIVFTISMLFSSMFIAYLVYPKTADSITQEK